MTNSTQLALCQAVVDAINAGPAITGTPAAVRRRRPMPQQTAAQVFVFYDESAAAPVTTTTLAWKTTIRVECVARDSGSSTAEEVADAMATAVFARVMADQRLGGLCIAINPKGTAVDADDGESDVCAIHVPFEVVHHQARTSIAHTP